MKKFFLGCFSLFLANSLFAQIPVLNSRSTSSAVIYLDFDGHTDNSGYWDDASIVAAAPTITSAQITEIFRRVSEDFAPFNINITTELAKYNNAAVSLRQRVVFTPTNYFYLDVGGVANTGSFGIGERPCWVFYGSGVYDAKSGAEAASHEVGHTLGLRHQSEFNSLCNKTEEYNNGTLPDAGQTSWAPIMGVGYYRNLTTWYHGPGNEGTCSGGNQNDINLILDNGFSYVTDDANNCGLTTACSKLISVSSNPALFTTGILKTGTEDDYYRFVSPRTGMMVFTASPKNISTSSVSGSQHGQDHTGANLDILMKLYNSSGATLAGSAENDDRLDAIFSNSVTSGQSYYIKIENDGLSSYRDFGYKNNDDFAIIGNYALRAFYPGVLASGISVLCPNVSIGFSTLASSASTYQWYYKAGTAAAPAVLTSTAGWLPVSGATSSSLVPATGVGVRTYACRVTYQGVSAWASGVRTITSIVPAVAQGAIASGNQTFNGSGDPNPINFSSAPSGGSGGFSYRWYFRPGIHPAPTGTTIPAGWSLIPTATTNTYDPPVVYSSVSYAVMVDPTGSPDCGVSAWAAGVRQITVNNGCITSYCISPGFIYNEGLYINSFRLGGTAITTGFNAGYASIGLGTQLLRSQSVAFNIAAGNNSAIGYLNIYYKLFADWNRDGDFTDLGEEVYASSAISGLGEVTGSFIVPSTASLGRTTIRVQLVDFRGANPCWDHFELESGEVEDYCVEILNNSFNPGVIDFANQTLCFGGDPNNIIFSTPPFPSAGSSFQWYYKDGLIAAPDGIASTAGWTLITGATSSSYDPPAALSVSRTYACRVINGPDNQWASGVRQITVFPLVISGVIEANNENFIGSGDPAVINLINAPRGGAGTFTYQWYSSPGIKSAPTGTVIPTGWTAIPGATSNSYNPPVQSASISFAVQVNPTGTPDCGDATWAASERQITVTSTSFTPGVIAAGNQTLCNPADPGSITFSAAATAGSTLQWYFQNGIIAAPAATAATTGWTLISGAGAASYDPPSGLTTSRTYACRVINGTNNQWASGVRQITVLPVFSPGSLIANQTGCNAYDPASITMVTNPQGSGAYNWRWYYQENATVTCPPGTNPPPSGWVTSTTDTRFFGTSTTGTGIFFDPSSPGATGRTWTLLITPAANGSIPACGTAQYATTCHRTIRQACRMEEDVTMLGDAYPNPADDMMQIPYFIADGQSKGSIKIFNSAGQLMHTFTCLSGKELVQQFSVSDLPSGVYYYSLEVNQTKISTRKLIVFH